MKPYQLGLYEKAMPEAWSWPHKMSAAGQLGFDFIEMSIDETQERQLRLEWSKTQRREFAAWSRQELCVSSHLPERAQKISDWQPFPGNPREGDADYGERDCACL